MRKLICFLLCAVMLFTLSACGGKSEPAPAQEPEQTPEQAPKEWTRQGYFTDEDGNMLSVTLMEDVVDPGWYVGVMLGDFWGGNTLAQEGGTLRGNIVPDYEEGEVIVTVSEEGEDGLLLTVEGGGTYHFTPTEMEEASVVVNINTEGWGNIDYAEGEEAPDIHTEYPFQSAYIGLAEPATYTFLAWPQAGNVFVKWLKNGEDFSTEPQITVLLDESADYVAVFEEDPGWQNPVMNFVGNYQCDRARALVECFGNDEAWITIEWAGSAWELARWDIVGRLDTDTLTVEYSGCTKSIVVYDDNGEVVSQEPEYEGGTGTVVFHDDGTFTWHEDQSEYGADMLFEWVPVTAAIDVSGSELYTAEELYAAVEAIRAEFDSWEGCELHSIRYAGDDADNAENLAWLNSLRDGAGFTQVAEFLSDFHSPVEEGPYAWEPDTEYTDYQWWLALTDGGDWELVSWGY